MRDAPSRAIAAAATFVLVPLMLLGCAQDDGQGEPQDSAQPAATESQPAPTPEADASGCTPALATGDAAGTIAEAADADGVGAEIDGPGATDWPQVSIAGGEGEGAAAGEAVLFDFTIFDGDTGARLGASTDDDGNPTVQLAGGEEPVTQMLQCAREGATIVLVATFGDIYGEGAAQLGVDAADPAVLVTDPVTLLELRATGTPSAGAADLPAVELADDGTPSIAWGDAPAPTAVSFSPTIVGDGVVVEADDRIVVHYSLFEWGTDTLRDGSWGSQPAIFPLPSLLDGVQQALAGQTVGSQIVLALPSADGYQDGDLLFVFDILAVVDR